MKGCEEPAGGVTGVKHCGAFVRAFKRSPNDKRVYSLYSPDSFFTALVLSAALAWPAAAAQPDRGQALYELRCQACHAESVHARAKRVAKDFGEVRGWVARWNASLSLGWTAEEIDDVTVHLNRRYYRYPCPPSICKIVSLAAPNASGRPMTAR